MEVKLVSSFNCGLVNGREHQNARTVSNKQLTKNSHQPERSRFVVAQLLAIVTMHNTVAVGKYASN